MDNVWVYLWIHKCWKFMHTHTDIYNHMNLLTVITMNDLDARSGSFAVLD